MRAVNCGVTRFCSSAEAITAYRFNGIYTFTVAAFLPGKNKKMSYKQPQYST
jgi:hypothetical protein